MLLLSSTSATSPHTRSIPAKWLRRINIVKFNSLLKHFIFKLYTDICCCRLQKTHTSNTHMTHDYRNTPKFSVCCVCAFEMQCNSILTVSISTTCHLTYKTFQFYSYSIVPNINAGSAVRECSRIMNSANTASDFDPMKIYRI